MTAVEAWNADRTSGFILGSTERVTLPTGPAIGTRVSVRHDLDAGTLTILAAGGDRIGGAGSGASECLVLSLPVERRELEYARVVLKDGTTAGVWYMLADTSPGAAP